MKGKRAIRPSTCRLWHEGAGPARRWGTHQGMFDPSIKQPLADEFVPFMQHIFCKGKIIIRPWIKFGWSLCTSGSYQQGRRGVLHLFVMRVTLWGYVFIQRGEQGLQMPLPIYLSFKMGKAAVETGYITPRSTIFPPPGCVAMTAWKDERGQNWWPGDEEDLQRRLLWIAISSLVGTVAPFYTLNFWPCPDYVSASKSVGLFI